MKYIAIINTPGYAPDREPEEFTTAQEAWEYLYDERAVDEEDSQVPDTEVLRALTWRVANPGVGSVTGPTPGYEGEHDLGIAYTVQAVN